MDGCETKVQVEEMIFVKRFEEMERTWATNNEMIRIFTLEMAETISALLKMEWPALAEIILIMTFVLRIVEMEGTLESYLEMMETQGMEMDVLPLVKLKLASGVILVQQHNLINAMKSEEMV